MKTMIPKKVHLKPGKDTGYFLTEVNTLDDYYLECECAIFQLTHDNLNRIREAYDMIRGAKVDRLVEVRMWDQGVQYLHNSIVANMDECWDGRPVGKGERDFMEVERVHVGDNPTVVDCCQLVVNADGQFYWSANVSYTSAVLETSAIQIQEFLTQTVK